MKFHVVYWSATGNTRAMAEVIAESGLASGAEVVIQEVGKAKVQDVLAADYIALGCPAMGAEVLEEEEMEPFITTLEKVPLHGKAVLLFGSYDWGDGEWMRNWKTRMQDAGAKVFGDGILVQNTPEQADIAIIQKQTAEFLKQV